MTSPRTTGPSGPGPGRCASRGNPAGKPPNPLPRHDDEAPLHDRGEQSSGHRSGQGQDQHDPHHVQDEARAQHQGATDQDQGSVGDLPRRHPTALERFAQRPPRPAALAADQPRTDEAVEDEQGDRPPRADQLADLQDGPDLHQRHEHERGHQRGAQPPASCRGPSRCRGAGHTLTLLLCSRARRSANPHRVISRSDSLATCPLIFESPRSRSMKSIGTSVRRRPRVSVR